jgi:triosephosphate isomerase
MHDASEGAFTGEIASIMLKEAGASFVILGHSERRHTFHESNEFIHRKLLRALKDDIQPVLCVGEKEGEGLDSIKVQLESALFSVPKEEALKILIAYEPVWAIGTGKVASLSHIETVHQWIRDFLKDFFGTKVGSKISILYGGSVKLDNLQAISHIKEVEGVLVGGASLDSLSFVKMIQTAEISLST